MTDEATRLLLGNTGGSAKFEKIGDAIQGTVISAEPRQSKDINGNLLFWDDGNKKMEVVVTLETDLRDPSIEHDDGTRRLYVRGQMMAAVREALLAKNHRASMVGGKLWVKFDSEGEPPQRGFSPPKIYKAAFQPGDPATAMLTDDAPDPEYARDTQDLGQYSDEPF